LCGFTLTTSLHVASPPKKASAGWKRTAARPIGFRASYGGVEVFESLVVPEGALVD
jgi:hypothetical protein